MFLRCLFHFGVVYFSPSCSWLLLNWKAKCYFGVTILSFYAIPLMSSVILPCCCFFHSSWFFVNHDTLVCFQTMGNETYIHIHPLNGPLSGTTQVSRYQKGKSNLDFTGARDSEWQWHQPGHTQVCTSLQTDNHASTPPLSFLQARCPSCRPTNSVKALKAMGNENVPKIIIHNTINLFFFKLKSAFR